RPARASRRPFPRRLREDVDTRAHVFAALGVVRRAGEQRGWPLPRALAHAPMEGGERTAELIRITADLVERDQAIELVEGRILCAFGHHRTCRLLEAGDEAEFTLVLAVPIPQQQRVADKVEDGRIGARVAVLRLGHGL